MRGFHQVIVVKSSVDCWTITCPEKYVNFLFSVFSFPYSCSWVLSLWALHNFGVAEVARQGCVGGFLLCSCLLWLGTTCRRHMNENYARNWVISRQPIGTRRNLIAPERNKHVTYRNATPDCQRALYARRTRKRLHERLALLRLTFVALCIDFLGSTPAKRPPF